MTKKITMTAALLLCATASQAAIVGFDLSPAGTDNAIGLSPLNETPAVTNSVGSGNEIGEGITFDTDSLTLSLSLGYGSAFGFIDLTGAAVAAHIHGPAPTNTAAPVMIDLSALHSDATNPATGGSFVGSIVLSTNDAASLLTGLSYVNIHTESNPGGEIRAQLVPVNVLPNLICPAATIAECTGDAGTLVQLSAQVADEDGDPLTVVWTANGTAIQTNSLAAGTTNLTSVPMSGLFQLGTNEVTVSVTDGIDRAVTCSTTVVVADTTPPTIESATIDNSVLWPPNHKLRDVSVSIVATDICGTVTSKIKSITSSQGVLTKGSGHTSQDWKITGDLSAKVRAERSGRDKNGRTYTLVIESTDNSGNAATTNLTVFVPHDQGKRGNTNAPVVIPPTNSHGHGNNGHGHSDNSHSKNK